MGYQVKMKAECEEQLLKMPPSVACLIQADRVGLRARYDHCLRAVTTGFAEMPAEDLLDYPHIMRELLLELKKQLRTDKLRAEAELEKANAAKAALPELRQLRQSLTKKRRHLSPAFSCPSTRAVVDSLEAIERTL